MQAGQKFIQFSITRPKVVTTAMVVMTLVLGALIARVHVDTDPENMLSADEFVRIFHDRTKKDFNLHDVVVLGVVNEKHEDGVFNPQTLKKIQILSEYAATLSDAKHPERKVVARDLIAPGNIDNIEQAGPGQVKLDWLMKEAPVDRRGSLEVRAKAMDNPLLKGTLVSEDGKAMGIYIPITSKDFAHKLSGMLQEKINSLSPGDEQYYITGLPVAEDTFGKEMFIQMAISAPLAMVMIFLLMFLFFRKIQLIISPMIIAMVTVICTMGLLIGTGNTLHIMSSMIPIFIMPIAVVDSIHILSEFFDEYQSRKNRRQTIEHVMNELFMPMLYTSLTSAVGFASLAATPIPPVRAFGIFVAIGIMLAFVLTIVFIPAYIMMMKEESLANFGAKEQVDPTTDRSLINRHLRWIGRISFGKAKMVIVFNLIMLAVAIFGITKIQVNDNPVKWFKKTHKIRVADRVLNSHFGGTYEAYLVLEGKERELKAPAAATWLKNTLKARLTGNQAVLARAMAMIDEVVDGSGNGVELADKLATAWEGVIDKLPENDDAGYEAWSTALDTLDGLRDRGQIFKRPDVLRYVEKLQTYLTAQGHVGKSNSVADLVKKVHKELFESDPGHFTIPESINGVTQCLFQVQSGHKPDDLWHLITPDYAKANIWLQLKSGDNKDMELVLEDVNRFFAENTPPVELQHQWAGLTYINVVWQEKMVGGMRNSFLSSFAVVFIMMALLFRSPVWGLLAMIPLTCTIAVIYGVIGLIGKDYDMPVAVLSSLTLGLAVDFAIHFLERARMTMKKTGDWRKAVAEMFEEPARAITRNTIVISLGFTPLLLAPLIPYQTVGVFLAAIMLYSGLATMWILPALLTIFQERIFRNKQ